MLKRNYGVYGAILFSCFVIACKKEKQDVVSDQQTVEQGINPPSINCLPSSINLMLGNGSQYYVGAILGECSLYEQIKYEGDRPVSAKGTTRYGEVYDCKFSYDNNGNLIRIDNYKPGEVLSKRYSRFEYPAGGVNSWALEVRYKHYRRKGPGAELWHDYELKYDYAGKVKTTTLGGSTMIAYKYEPVLGNLMNVTYIGINGDSTLWYEYSNYDNRNNLYRANRVWAMLSGIQSRNNARNTVYHNSNLEHTYIHAYTQFTYAFNSLGLLQHANYNMTVITPDGTSNEPAQTLPLATYGCVAPLPPVNTLVNAKD